MKPIILAAFLAVPIAVACWVASVIWGHIVAAVEVLHWLLAWSVL